jgi:hypothetical protein
MNDECTKGRDKRDDNHSSREIDPLSVIVPISKIRKPHLPIGLNIWNTLYMADVPSKKWFRIVFREDQPSTKEQPEGARPRSFPN